MKYFLIYLSSFFLYILLDMLWIQVIAKNFIHKMVGPLMAENADLKAGILFYLIFAAGITVFAVVPALESGSWTKAMTLGALLGLVSYGTYELVNRALLKNWPYTLVWVDIAYGIIACALVSTLVYWLADKFFWQ
ncbi:MAG: DUF2177 family protein [Saprospiraceae bacterium]